MPQSPAALRVGVVLPGRESVVERGDYPRHLGQLAQRIEELGYDSIWAGESPLARSRMNPLLALTAAATTTERVELGTAVLLPLRPPVHLAHELACLDRICGGRLITGIGSGFNSPAAEAEFQAYGIPFTERVGRMRETLEICQALWHAQGEPVSYEGRYHSLQDVALLPVTEQPSGPPVWIAHGGEKMLERTGRQYDGWMPTSTTSGAYAKGWLRVQEAREAAGRPEDDVTAAVYLSVAVDDSLEKAEDTLQAYFRAYYRLDLPTMRTTQGIFGGTAEQVAEWLGGYIDAGARHLVLRLPTADLHEPRYRAALERTAEELLPLLRGLA
ncbi:LLM class flavin-dependent oxidoreductase [Streptomyces dangxiongensis]|uniref:LLM class flavin-dependent oxidoreductase n=1 Tax=Streptomyces dangxiongensis TaxID=1442032 RepID=A0A3G2JL39_9ACTN|nr:LLM class flavin-dependent oxidoreductase [Streptomyces dangxiongensis]AYN43140.1 LLM class flavin-dependent oxidoreductase [Streptomyces dangxiongensis]